MSFVTTTEIIGMDSWQFARICDGANGSIICAGKGAAGAWGADWAADLIKKYTMLFITSIKN